ncbi:MAG: DNA mismatch repair endonuclease MutL, partial [Alphaproteobacteria bacterium]
MTSLRLLPQNLVNQIAAGEVVERPASVVKELVENAIDAGAKRIEVQLQNGGKNLIRIIDDGKGMNADEMALAVQRHATSKLPDDDLVDIRFLGFRGEALPSIGSVARLSITSRQADADTAWHIKVEAGNVTGPSPAAGQKGTTLEVSDLFYATPARLKFMKADRSEYAACLDVVTRLAMAHADISFTLTEGTRQAFRLRATGRADLFASRLDRLSDLLGREFAQNACRVEREVPGLKLSGYVALPTLNKANSLSQYIFVNGRSVKDRQLFGVLRAAYSDYLVSNRYPVVALFIEVEPHLVDVNVHPAKTEVRFRDAAAVRSLLINGVRNALEGAGFKSSSTG